MFAFIVAALSANAQNGITVVGVSAAGNCDGTATLDPSAISSQNWSWNNGATVLQSGGTSIDSLCEGTYQLNYLDSTSTNVTLTFVIAVNPCANVLIQATIANNPATASGSCDGSIAFSNPSGGQSPYLFGIQGGTPPVANTVISNLCAGTYNAIVQDVNGCKGFFSAVITNPADSCAGFMANVTHTDASTPNNCDGTMQVQGQGGLSPYLYSSDLGATYIAVNNFSNLCTGNKLIKVKDSNFCTFDAIAMIGVDSTNTPCANSTLAVNLTSTNATTAANCDGTLTATVTGFGTGFTFLWSNNLGSTNTNLTNLCSGNYTITVTSNGCTITASGTIDITPTNTGCAGSTLAAIVTGTNAASIASCDGSLSINAYGGTTPYEYSSDNGVTFGANSNFNNLCSGQHLLALKDAAGCVINYIKHVGIDSVSTTNPCANNTLSISLLATPSSSPVTCDGTITATVTGGILPIVPTWNIAGSNSLIVNNLCPDTYTLTVVDGNGCSMTATTFVGGYVDSTTATQMPLSGYVIPTGVSADGYCDGNASTIAYGGVQPYTYTYGSANAAAVNNAISLCAGVQNVTVFDANGDSLLLDFIISSPINTVGTTTFTDSTLVDSVYNTAITDCVIDYSLIDSVYIAGFNILPNDSLFVTWGVVYNGILINITDYYGLTIAGQTAASAGVYMLALQLFCPNKSIGNFLTATDQLYYNAAAAGMEDNNIKDTNVSIYPNPFTDQITILIANNEASEVVITDIAGKVVMNKKFKNNLIKMDMSGVASGQYIVTIKNDNSTIIRKMVK